MSGARVCIALVIVSMYESTTVPKIVSAVMHANWRRGDKNRMKGNVFLATFWKILMLLFSVYRK